jgi:pyrimidine operon attenuation protein/uracil phosphoribosyltransferase
MTARDIEAALKGMAIAIAQGEPPLERLVLLGILRRGRPLADRLARLIHDETGISAQVGSLATTLYRDDLRSGKGTARISGGETRFDFDVNGATVVLVDDVIFAGRTARAALDEVMDYGRPDRVRLACLIDRGCRDLPIQPDYIGKRLATRRSDHVAVLLEELDGEDVVLLERARDGE